MVLAKLTKKHCVPCEGGIPAMKLKEIRKYLGQIKSWKMFREKGIYKIKKRYKLSDFIHAIKFVNKIANLAENEGHHPDIHISYNILDIVLWTHAVKGLSENDFILAAKIDGIYKKL